MAKRKKKTNPNRIPVTKADVNRAKKEATDKAIELVWSIFFTVLRDKEHAQHEDLVRVWSECEDLSESIKLGYCTVSDLRTILKEEEGAVLV